MPRWRKWFLPVVLTGLLVFVPLFVSGAQEGQPGETNIHITQVDNSAFPVVTVYFSVTDSEGEPVGVTPNRISLSENGTVIQPDSIQGLGELEALTTLLVFDVSGSMNEAGKLETAKVAARAFVEQMRFGDRTGLLLFNTSFKYVQDLTTDQPSLISAIEGALAEEDTALFDALLEAVEVLSIESGRKAIIVLTDGLDNRSHATVEEVLARIGPEGLTISTVGLGLPEQLDATTAGLDEPTLRSLAARAGGEYAYANDSEGLKSLYERYARTLQSEYVLTYTSPSGLRDGLTRSLSVSLIDEEIGLQLASYNPGGLVPEVAKPASWAVFLAGLGGLIGLLFLPTIVGRGFELVKNLRSTVVPARKSRIRFKDT